MAFKLYKNKTGSFLMFDETTNRMWTVSSANADTERHIRRIGFVPNNTEMGMAQARVYGDDVAAWVAACKHVGVPPRMVVATRDPISKIVARFELPVKASRVDAGKIASLELVKELNVSAAH